MKFGKLHFVRHITVRQQSHKSRMAHLSAGQSVGRWQEVMTTSWEEEEEEAAELILNLVTDQATYCCIDVIHTRFFVCIWQKVPSGSSWLFKLFNT